MARLASSDTHGADAAITALFSGLNPEDPLYKALYAEVEKRIKQVVDAKAFNHIQEEFNKLLAKVEEEQASIEAAYKKRKTEEQYANEDKEKAQAATQAIKSEYREPLEIVAQIVAELVYHHAQLQEALHEKAQVEYEMEQEQRQLAEQVGEHLANKGIVLQNGQVVRLPANAPAAVQLQKRLQGQPLNPLQLVQGLPAVNAQFVAQRNAALVPQPRPAVRQNREEEAERIIQAEVHASRVALEAVNAQEKHKRLRFVQVAEAIRAHSRDQGYPLDNSFDNYVERQLGALFEGISGQRLVDMNNRLIAAVAKVHYQMAHIDALVQRLGQNASLLHIDMLHNAMPEYRFRR